MVRAISPESGRESPDRPPCQAIRSRGRLWRRWRGPHPGPDLREPGGRVGAARGADVHACRGRLPARPRNAATNRFRVFEAGAIMTPHVETSPERMPMKSREVIGAAAAAADTPVPARYQESLRYMNRARRVLPRG